MGALTTPSGARRELRGKYLGQCRRSFWGASPEKGEGAENYTEAAREAAACRDRSKRLLTGGLRSNTVPHSDNMLAVRRVFRDF